MLLLAVVLAGCSDPGSVSLRERLAQAESEVQALRAGRQVLERRLAATRRAATAAGEHLLRARRDRDAALASAAQWRDAHRSIAGMLSLRDRELLAVRHGMARLGAELAASARGLVTVEERNADLARQVAALSGWLGQRTAQGQAQGNALRQSEDRMEEGQRRAGELADRLAGIRDQLDAANDTVSELKASNSELGGIVRTLNEELTRTRQAADSRTAALDVSRESLLAELEDVRVQATELATRNEQLGVRMAALREQVAAANDQADGYRRARQYLDDKLQDQNVEMASLREALSQLRAQRDEVVAAMAARRQELLQTITESERANARAGARVAELERDNATLVARVAALQASADDFRRAKDYLDGKLAAQDAEIERERREHRLEVTRLEESLRLALEEVRLLQLRAPRSGAERDATLEQAASQRGALLEQIAALREELQALSAERASEVGRREALVRQVESLRGELSRALAAEAEAANARDALHERIGARESTDATPREERSPKLLAPLDDTRSERDTLARRLADESTRHAQAIEAERQERAQLAREVAALSARAASYAQTLEYVTGLKEQQQRALDECRSGKT